MYKKHPHPNRAASKRRTVASHTKTPPKPTLSRAASRRQPDSDEIGREDLLKEIRRIIRRRQLTQRAAAEVLGIRQPNVSTLMRGTAKDFSTERLLRFLTALSKDVEIVLKAKPPSRPRGVVRVQEQPVATTHVTLATATDIAAWAERQDARGALPQLIRRLVLTNAEKISEARFRTEEGTDLAGWDGFTTSESSDAHVPLGGAGWELSVRKDVTVKATEDLAARLKDSGGADPRQTTFVFVTARRWPGKSQWVQEQSKKKRWREVTALDADDLEGWLELNPAVHIWFSRAIGKRPDDVVDVETFWSDWSQATHPTLSTDFLLAGRADSKDQIHAAIRNRTATISIRSESKDEALAVLCASVIDSAEPERSAWLSRMIVVRTPSAWDRLSGFRTPLILVPLFDDVELVSRALRTGHQVLVAAGLNQPETPTTIEVPRLAVGSAKEALARAGLNEARAADLAVLARRSLMGFRRTISIRPELQQPRWAHPSAAAEALPFMLAGNWNESSEGDLEILRELAQSDSRPILELARRLSREADPIIRSTGNVWYVASKEDSWQLLSPAMTRPDIERFKTAVLAVLGTPDPRLDVEVDKRWFSTSRPPHSAALRRGLSETLAIMGARGASPEVAGYPVETWAEIIVRDLLGRANKEWRLWASLSSDLPLLAEAAPTSFLSAVEDGLQSDQPILKLFIEEGDPMFASAAHSGLLWALERLMWSPEYLSRSALILARLTRLDPGGKWANRPGRSLRETFLLWHPQTAATWAQQMQVFKTLLDREPQSGWQLLAALLPRSHDSSFSRTKPQWREWAPENEPTFTIGDQIARISDLTNLMLEQVGTNGKRWRDLIEAVPNMHRDVHDAVIAYLDTLDAVIMPSEDQSAIWSALREVVSHHRSFPTAAWALPKERIDTLETLLHRFEPHDTLQRYGWLFAHHVRLPEGRRGDWQDEEKAVAEARHDAVVTIYRENGLGALEDLAPRVEHPGFLGNAFGATDLATAEEDVLLRKHLASSQLALRKFARGFVQGRVALLGQQWTETKFALGGLSPAQKAELLVLLPNDPRTWEFTRSQPEVEAIYWREAYPHFRGSGEDIEYAAEHLIKYKRAFAAAELVAFHLKDPTPPRSDLVATVLEAMLLQEKPDATFDGLSYWIGELLDSLGNRGDMDETRVAQIEWSFARLLRHDRQPRVLHRELSRNPKFFVELISLIFRREDQEAPEPTDVTESQRQRAGTAFDVLDSWKSVPGVSANGGVDIEVLREWVTTALKLGTQEGHQTITAQQVGRVMCYSPSGMDGAWPHEAVRDLIDELENRELQRGFEIGTYNKRGVVTRSLQDGGRQERELAVQFASWADQIRHRWPRTADVLRRIEESYRDQARREDRETELREDGLW